MLAKLVLLLAFLATALAGAGKVSCDAWRVMTHDARDNCKLP